MTTVHDIDLPTVLAQPLTSTHPDVLRELIATFIHTLMGAADVCGAGYGERSSARTNQRNGYCHRQFDTRAGTLDLAIPKLRHGSYFPDWLLERRKRAEHALTTVVATCYLLGVSARRMDKVVETLGIMPVGCPAHAPQLRRGGRQGVSGGCRLPPGTPVRTEHRHRFRGSTCRRKR